MIFLILILASGSIVFGFHSGYSQSSLVTTLDTLQCLHAFQRLCEDGNVQKWHQQKSFVPQVGMCSVEICSVICTKQARLTSCTSIKISFLSAIFLLYFTNRWMITSEENFLSKMGRQSSLEPFDCKYILRWKKWEFDPRTQIQWM